MRSVRCGEWLYSLVPRSPDYLHRVVLKGAVLSYDRSVLANRLRDNQSIERIAMVEGQVRNDGEIPMSDR